MYQQLNHAACCAVIEQLHSPCGSGCHHSAPADANVAGPSSEGADPSGPNGPYSRATLVICPLVAVIQWRQEIARYVAPNALRVRPHLVSFSIHVNQSVTARCYYCNLPGCKSLCFIVTKLCFGFSVIAGHKIWYQHSSIS